MATSYVKILPGDVGGQRTLRPYWRNYFEQTDALVWVVDSGDRMRMIDCKDELHGLLTEDVSDQLVPTIATDDNQLVGMISYTLLCNVSGLPALLYSSSPINRIYKDQCLMPRFNMCVFFVQLPFVSTSLCCFPLGFSRVSGQRSSHSSPDCPSFPFYADSRPSLYYYSPLEDLPV